MADPELNEILGHLETQIASEDESVERAKASLEATLASLKLTPEEEAALSERARRSCATSARSSRSRPSRSPPSAWSAAASRRS